MVIRVHVATNFYSTGAQMLKEFQALALVDTPIFSAEEEEAGRCDLQRQEKPQSQLKIHGGRFTEDNGHSLTLFAWAIGLHAFSLTRSSSDGRES